jgi:hypothetical protein
MVGVVDNTYGQKRLIDVIAEFMEVFSEARLKARVPLSSPLPWPEQDYYKDKDYDRQDYRIVPEHFPSPVHLKEHEDREKDESNEPNSHENSVPSGVRREVLIIKLVAYHIPAFWAIGALVLIWVVLLAVVAPCGHANLKRLSSPMVFSEELNRFLLPPDKSLLLFSGKSRLLLPDKRFLSFPDGRLLPFPDKRLLLIPDKSLDYPKDSEAEYD